MSAFDYFFKLSLLLSLLPNSITAINSQKSIGVFHPDAPLVCSSVECPSFVPFDFGEDYEIRLYHPSVWVSTAPIIDISFVNAARRAFFELTAYLHGKNKNGEIMERTAPMITNITESDKPYWEPSWSVVSSYLPKKHHENPPPALDDDLHFRKWEATYIAVKQFYTSVGPLGDSQVRKEAQDLKASLEESKWSPATGVEFPIMLAQYNHPFDSLNLVNEIWIVVNPKEPVAISL